ncbi:DUF3231 family protein [Metabacillus sp. RGM 3146]|uniref:DUF3231 family protein n=1 Tax=Metabacillus sp. RGM 3146 TaxID=3401092 RepID=UPI003B9CD4DD
MVQHNINLTTPEITALWSTYIQESASLCFLKHFLKYMEDEEILQLLKEAIDMSSGSQDMITAIFKQEKFPVPEGFSDRDVMLEAPPLYTDLNALRYVYRASKLTLHSYATHLINVARSDLLEFFIQEQINQVRLYEKAVKLMLSKGIYDRPPKIPYPDRVHYAEQKSYIGHFFGDKRPLNSFELSEAFFNIENNYIGLIFLLGMIQVSKDEELKHYLIKGKHLALMQIDVFNKLLREEGHFGTLPVSLEVTDSIESPFSAKLILFSVASATSTAISLIGKAVSYGLRKDITAHFLLVAKEILSYSEEGAKIMIKRGWFEEPPQSD